AGLAGLSAAMAAAPAKVLGLTEAPLNHGCSSAWAQGGVAAALSGDHAPELHAADTVAAGAGLAGPGAPPLGAAGGPAGRRGGGGWRRGRPGGPRGRVPRPGGGGRRSARRSTAAPTAASPRASRRPTHAPAWRA